MVVLKLLLVLVPKNWNNTNTKPPEGDHVYEMLPGEVEETASKDRQENYCGYVMTASTLKNSQ